MKFIIFMSLFLSSLIPFESTYATSLSQLMKKYGEKENYLVFAVPVNINNIDPSTSLNAHSSFTLPLIFEPLISINPLQELKPALAKSWYISPDKKSLIIKLRQNHHFSDNTEVTAHDVVNSIKRLCNTNHHIPVELRNLSGCMESSMNKSQPKVTALDKYRVKFDIDGSPATFLYQLASPKTVIVKQGKNGLIGSGPYLVEEQQKNYIVLKSNPYYSNASVVNNSGIILFHVAHGELPNVLKEAKPDGALMYMVQSDWQLNDTNYNIIKTNSNITKTIVLNNSKFPFNNKLFRQAFIAAIYNNLPADINPKMHKAYGIIPAGIGGSIDNAAPNFIKPVSLNELTKELPQLKNNKLSIIIHENLDFKNKQIEKKIIDAGNKLNLNIKFKYYQNYEELWALYGSNALDAFIELYVYRNREAYSVIQFFTKHGSNDATIQTEKLDEMLNDALKTQISHYRYQKYKKIAQYLQNDGIVIPLYYMDHDNIMSKCLEGISDNFYLNPFSYLPQMRKIKLCNLS